MSQLPILPPFIPNRTRVANLVPFTYRDSMTMLEKIENLQKYVVEFVPEVNAAVAILVAEFEAINEAQLVEFNIRFTDFVEHINALVALINNKTGPVDVQHVVLSVGSDTTVIIDPLFPDNQPITYVAEKILNGGNIVVENVGTVDTTIFSTGAVIVFRLVPKTGGGWVIEYPTSYKTFLPGSDRVPLIWDDELKTITQPSSVATKEIGFSEILYNYKTGETGWEDAHTTRPIHLNVEHRVTDTPDPLRNISQGIVSSLDYEGVGTTHNFSARSIIKESSDPNSEHAAYFGYIRYENGSKGRAWFADFNVQGPVGQQPTRLVGITMFMGNYYDGSPSATPSAGQWIVSNHGGGGGRAEEHESAETYPIDVGLGVIGKSGSLGTRQSFKTGVQIGGGGAWGVPGGAGGSRVGVGIDVSDYETAGINVRAKHPDKPGAHAIVVQPAAGKTGLGAGNPTHQLHVREVDTSKASPLLLEGGGGQDGVAAFMTAQSRARFGFSGTAVTVDDNDTNRNIVLKNGGEDRATIYAKAVADGLGVAGAMRLYSGRLVLGFGKTHIFGDTNSSAVRLNGVNPSGNFLIQNEDGSDTIASFSAKGTRLNKSVVPATSTSDGQPGQVAWSSTHFYVCVANNVWKRTLLEAW